SVPWGVGATPPAEMLNSKLAHVPVPPTVIEMDVSSLPLPSRKRALATASKAVPTPATCTGSSTRSKGWGWRTLRTGNPGMVVPPGKERLEHAGAALNLHIRLVRGGSVA